VNRQRLHPMVAALLGAAFVAALVPNLAYAQGKAKDPGKNQQKAEAKAEAKQLHQQIAALKKQRDATIKRVRDMFGKMISQDRLTKQEMDEHRKALIHERDTLAQSASPGEKEAIHKHFDSVIHSLGHAERMDKKQIEALKNERHEMVKNVEHQYNASIRALEDKVKALGGGGKKK
jgi:uncharacterized protein (DUF2336 family)